MMNKKGFTLVELMVVIVIIGVLAAVAIPKFSAATNKAKASEFPTILSNIVSSQESYKAEMNGYADCSAKIGSGVPVGAAPVASSVHALLDVDVSETAYFTYTAGATDPLPAGGTKYTKFKAEAILAKANLGTVIIDKACGVDEAGFKYSGGVKLTTSALATTAMSDNKELASLQRSFFSY